LKNELDLNIRLQNQTRDIDYLVIPQSYYATQVDLTGDEGEAAINSYYDLNTSRFSIAEKVSIEYLYITRQDSSTIVISDGQIADFYNENLANYETNERRHLAHILVNISADAEQASIDAAEVKINDIASRLQAGAVFEELAMSDSEDASTAEFGGDLDWIEIGMMDAAFEEAAFNLDETNNTSLVVKTGFGFHIIKLLEIEKGGAQPLTEVKDQIVTTLQSEFVDDKFLEAKDIISEKAFEISDSLVEAAEAGNIIVLNTPMFDAQFGSGLPAELRNQPSILDMAFSDDVLYQGLNSELIELTDGNAVILRLLEHQESGISALADVREQVISILTNERIRQATESAGNLVITALREEKTAQESLSTIPEDLPVTWQQQIGLTRTGTEIEAQLRNEVFRIPTPATDKPVYKGILLGTGNYAVISLNGVNDGVNANDEDAENKLAELDKKFNDYYLQADIYNYLNYLDEKATITRTISSVDFIQ
jgi:peptidyl-prolyl cis-trans isomerase D